MEQRISIERLEQAINLFGSFDENIRLIESEFHVTVANREGELRVNGEPEDTMLACKALSALLTLSNRGEAINEQNVRYVIGLARSGQEEKIGELTQDVICISAKGRPIKPKTIGQKEYVDSISQNTVTIGVGPAGTGKTYLAVAAAVAAFGLAFCPAICRARSIPTSARSTTRSLICSARRPIRSISSAATSRSRLSPICAAARSTTALSFSTRRRTPPASR